MTGAGLIKGDAADVQLSRVLTMSQGPDGKATAVATRLPPLPLL